MVRLAQWFSVRTPLVDGHGNFGNIDGDGAAAMRYTESRLAKPAMELLRDLQKDTVDWQPNYDESLQEPQVLPARFPNLLVNGSSGIAVGMATNIPPHNLGEAVEATCMLIDNPDATTDELMTVMPGPDFPTGAVIMGTDGIREAYETGRGSITVRAKAHVETTKTGRSRLVFTEIPYQVNKGALQEKIAQLVNEKRIEGVSDMRDESNQKGIRLVIELKKDIIPQVVLNNLYKFTQLQTTFGVNNLALVHGVPKCLSLREILQNYIEHQVEVSPVAPALTSRRPRPARTSLRATSWPSTTSTRSSTSSAPAAPTPRPPSASSSASGSPWSRPRPSSRCACAA